jgi:hypothetical protein
MDAEWATPNIFQLTKGKRMGNTLNFDPESMKRLDYLIYNLKKEGIYIYMDMLTYRKFKKGDGVEAFDELKDAAKPYCIFDPKLIELQKKYNYDLWNHINPYTGLAYKDEPAIVLTEIINEGDIFSIPVEIPYYKNQLNSMFDSWLKDKNIEKPEEGISYPLTNPIVINFFSEIQENYYNEMMSHLRNLGVKIPIAGTNWPINAANRKTQLVTDFDDGHTYWYDWKWKEDVKEFGNKPMMGEIYTILGGLTFSRHVKRPFFVSEWDEPWPNEWRAESSIYMAAIGSLQNWAGFAIHTYSYSSMKDIQITGKEVTSQSIGSVPYREGVFNAWNDPAKFGLFYHSALIMRRSDLKEANQYYGIKIVDIFAASRKIPALNLITEKHKTGIVLMGSEKDSKYFDKYDLITPEEIAIETDKGEIVSDTGELYRSWSKKIGWIDTEKTKAVYGFVGKVPSIELKDINFEVQTDFATIALSSLTDSPINSSDNILLTTVGRSVNTDMEFNEEHNIMLDVGRPPILVETIKAKIQIRTKIDTLKIWAVNAEGFFAGVIPSTYEDGVFEFSLGEKFASMYYLIQGE